MLTNIKETLYSSRPIQRRGRIAWAQAEARKLLARCSVTTKADVRLDVFTRDLRVKVIFCRLDSANAQLVRIGDRAFIFISDRVTDRAAIRFSIAHELGHLVLGHPCASVAQLADHRPVRTWYSPEHEAEADAFASELLMPRSLLADICTADHLDLDLARQIAAEYDVSILASAIRITELSPHRCGAVLSRAGRVKWFAKSNALQDRIDKGQLLRPYSVACRFFIEGTLVERPCSVPAEAWFERRSTSEILEHAVASHRYGTVLSFLWVPSDPTATPHLCVTA